MQDIPQDTAVTLCVCAMWRTKEKGCVKSLVELLEARHVNVIWLDESILFDDDALATFPTCTTIWTLYSPDLPLVKVSAYVDRCKCLELNSIEGLQTLRDRRSMFRLLVQHGIPVPRHVECNRDDADGVDPNVEEFDDYIVINGTKLSKPFLEKPADADNHDVCIYYPRAAGGGKTRLDKNVAVFEERGRIRRHGSYIYEKFITSEGFETRLFVVNSVVNEQDRTYIFAEAKTSVPATAESRRRVLRDVGGNSVLASADEKLVCPKIANAFSQTTFKVDLLRTQTADSEEKFFVYDVSVKGGALKNRGGTYLDEVAQALYADIVKQCPALASSAHNELIDAGVSKEASVVFPRTYISPRAVQFEELLCVWSLVRHGDRTPKRKLKLQFPCEDPFTAGWLLGWLQGGEIQDTLYKFFHERRDSSKCVELRSTEQLQRLLLILKQFEEQKYLPLGGATNSLPKSDGDKVGPPLDSGAKSASSEDNMVHSGIGVLESAFDAKSDSRQYPHAKVEVHVNCIKVTLKWGGELTSVGREQALDLGERFRQSNFPFDDAAQLHATLRHDVKVYSSAEPRCRQTAGAFTKGFLNLTGPLPQIIVSFVRNDGLGRLTDAPFLQAAVYDEIKKSIRNLQESKPDLVRNPEQYVYAAEALESIREEFGDVGAAVVHVCEKVICLIDTLKNLAEMRVSNTETTTLMALRWADILSQMQKDNGAISRCWDASIYDVRHNLPFFKDDPDIQDMLLTIKSVSIRMREILGPYEFGRTGPEKAKMAAHYVSPLIRKLRWDLRVASGLPLEDEKDALQKHKGLYGSSTGWRPIRTRLYFAHNSHMQTIVNVLRFGGEEIGNIAANCLHFPPDIGNLGYCSHLVVKLFRSADVYVARFFLSPGDAQHSDSAKDPLYLGEMPMTDLDGFLSQVIDFAAEETGGESSTKLGSYR